MNHIKKQRGMIMKERDKKKRKIRWIMLVILLLLMISMYIYYNWIPVKFAVKEELFKKYENMILVKEVHYTGTGWTQIGNETGYFNDKEIKDIHIIGNRPPIAKMMQNVNIFLCEVEYQGKLEFRPTGEVVDTYLITEWYPVYPVVRDSLIPKLFLPKHFMSKRDIPSY